MVLKPSEDTPYCGGLLFAEIFAEAGVPEGRAERGDLLAGNVGRGGRGADRQPAGEGNLLHRLDRGRPPDRGARRRAPEEMLRRARRQGRAHRLRRRRPRARQRQAANFGSFMHQGQICMSVEKRASCTRRSTTSSCASFLDRAAEAQGRRDPPTGRTSSARVINDSAADRLKRAVRRRRGEGRQVLAGGKIEGRFVEPTIFDRRHARHEALPGGNLRAGLLGLPFRTDDEAIASPTTASTACPPGVMTARRAAGPGDRQPPGDRHCHINCSPGERRAARAVRRLEGFGHGASHGGRWSTETFTETRWITLDRGGRPYPPMF